MLAAMAVACVFCVAPATAGTRKSPPPFNVTNRGESFRAALGAYEWCYKDGDHTTCAAAETIAPPTTEKALPVKPGDRIVLRPHAKVKSIQVSQLGAGAYPNQPRRVDGKPRVWTLKIASGVGKRKNLVAFVRYAAQGSDATFGFGIRRVENKQGSP